MSTNPGRFYDFGSFRVDESERLLLRGEDIVPLTPKAFEMLLVLVESNGRVLTKEELMKRVWPDSFVEEANLSHNIYKLREALGEGRNGEKYIETLPRRGYRFVAKVTEGNDPGANLLVEEHSRARIVVEEDDRFSEAMRIVSVPGHRGGKPLAATASQSVRFTKPVGLIAVVVGLVGLIAAVYLWSHRSNSVHAGTELRSIAVLPFKPLVVSQRDESLEIGMADTLIAKLSGISQLTVRPTSGVRKYTDPQQDALTAGRELIVDSVLEGNIQKAGDQLRVTARLVRVSDGATLWAEKFDERFTDVFAVQDSIAERVAAAITPKLTAQERLGLSKRYTESAEAYQLYLKGRYHWSTFRQADLLTSINYYNAALEKDPTYALAYAGLAHSYAVIGIWGPLPARETMPKSIEAAKKAVELDDELAEAHLGVGAAKIFYEWDWPGAERELLRARQLARADSNVYTLYSYYLRAMGRAGDAVAEARRAKEVAPLFHVAADDYPWALFIARRYDEAISFCEQELKLDPQNEDLHIVLGMSHTQLGMYDRAVAELQHGLAIEKNGGPGATMSDVELGVTYAFMGKSQEARRQIAEVEKFPLSWTPFWVAEIYAALGDRDAAFASLEKGYVARCPFLWEIRSYPQFDNLRSDPRYANLLRRMNLSL